MPCWRGVAERAHPWSPAQPLAAASPQSFVVASAASVASVAAPGTDSAGQFCAAAASAPARRG